MHKNKISLSDIKHSNAKRMEYFLNAVEAELKEVAFDWRILNLADHIGAGCKFASISMENPIVITVLFCNSYSEAIEIAKANAFPSSPHARWSANGDLLYLVESKDERKVSEVLSLFAGKE